MKVFHKRFVRLIYLSKTLDELIENLDPWIELVNVPDSPLMLQISSYFLRKFGSSAAPVLFKKITASEIFRIAGKEDMKCTIILAIVEAYRTFRHGKGTNLASWLSWRIPYIASKYLQCRQVRYIGPFEEAYEIDYSKIEKHNRQLDIIADELKISSALKNYYMKRSIRYRKG